jgi:membrane protease YdiL (CAAX protease family)
MFEVVLVSLAKTALPFAVLGGVILWAFAEGSTESTLTRIPLADPVENWEATLSVQGLFRMIVLSWLTGPIIEEIVFRGLLYRAWERQWGWVASTVLTSACFGLVHPTHITAAFLGSIVYICVLRRTGSLKACILVHMLFNVLVSWPVLGQFLFTVPTGDPAKLATWSLPVACLALTALALPAYVWMARKDRRPDCAF